MLQLGYACINETLAAKGYSVNTGCKAKTVRELGIECVKEKITQNLKTVIKILMYNENNDIKLYRLSSAMFSNLTNPEFIYENEKYSYRLGDYSTLLKRIGELAHNFEHRLTFHPDFHVQLATESDVVLQKSILDLEYHCDVLDIMGCDKQSVLVLHVGGVYGDRIKTMKRWVKRFCSLPANIRDRLVLENCERGYSIRDTLWVSRKIKKKTGRNIPCVFDTHHDECYRLLYADHNLDESENYMKRILKTWDNVDIIPKFHISEQDEEKRIGAHSRYVETIPQYLFDISRDRRVDIMIEAKAKERAVLKLKKKYGI